MVILPGILSPVTEISPQKYGIPVEDKVSIEIERVYHEIIKRWDKAAIKLLCHTADEYILQVEDIFFAYDKELGERLSESSKTISLEELRRVIELSS